MTQEYKPKCSECERPYDLQEKKPVMIGEQRMISLMTLFISAALTVSCYLGFRYFERRAEINKFQYEICIKTNHAADQCVSDHVKPARCAADRQMYQCCVSEDTAKQQGCWR